MEFQNGGFSFYVHYCPYGSSPGWRAHVPRKYSCEEKEEDLKKKPTLTRCISKSAEAAQQPATASRVRDLLGGLTTEEIASARRICMARVAKYVGIDPVHVSKTAEKSAAKEITKFLKDVEENLENAAEADEDDGSSESESSM